VQRERRIRAVADVGLDDRRVDPRRASSEACLAQRLLDHHPGDVLDDVGAQPAGELAHRRLVRHALVDRDQTEAPQVQRVRDLARSVS
jgi:hypothetical protein